MQKMTFLLVIAAIIFTAASAFQNDKNRAEADPVPFPEGYRYWAHVKTGFIGPNNPGFKFSGGFHHIYANDKALEGYKIGKFPQGSILAFDVINYKESNGNFDETNRKHLDVMVKDSIKYNSTGGWGFEEFEKDSHTQRNLTPTIQAQCANCHHQTSDYVFSRFRD